MVAVVDHLTGHAAIDADVLARDEACLVATEEEHHMGNVHGVAHTASRLLRGIRTFVHGVGRVYPSGGDGVDPRPSRQAHGQGMREGGDASLGGRVALCLRLAHAVARGGDVDDGCALSQVLLQQFHQIEGGGDAHTQGILELLVGALVDAPHQGQGVVDDDIHLGVLAQHLGDVAHKVVALLLVNHIHYGSLLAKLIGNASANATGTAGHNHYFIFKHNSILFTTLYRKK